MIAKVVGLDRSVISRNVQNTKIGNMHNLLSQGHDMDYIARHYNMDLPLVWALRLEGKTDQEKFKEPGWGLPGTYLRVILIRFSPFLIVPAYVPPNSLF